MKKVLVICGATATGKTSLAVECALKLNTEIISADSLLVYKGLNIGTAKPADGEKRGVVHHMIDVVDPQKTFSVGDYRDMALPITENILKRGKTPVICGGTGFYINSLLFKMSYGNAVSVPEVRKKYEDYYAVNGKEVLYALLEKVDPETAEKLHANDIKRVIRALEIYEVSGIKKSAQHDGAEKLYDYVAVAVNFPRELLYERIEKRVDKMFKDGLVDEVKGLLNKGIDGNFQCMQAIGYKEVLENLKNGNSESTMRDIIKKNTRHYAKRQITFFKKLPDIIWLDYDKISAEKITELLNER